MSTSIENLYKNMHRYHLEMMIEVKRICELYKIDYYLIGGTLLGAVRHGGFIPWDDDADMAIKREDYDLFINACRKEIDSKFRIDVCQNDKNNFACFIKIKYKNILFLEESNEKLDVNHELFIDVFPLDNIPDDINERKKHGRIIKKLKFILYGKYGVPSKNVVLGVIKQTFSKLYPVSKEQLKKIYIKESTKYNNLHCEKRRVFCSTYDYEKEVMPNKDLNNPVDIVFEGIKFTTFTNYKDYLENLYGNYMELPPEDKRYGYKHASLKIGVGDA